VTIAADPGVTCATAKHQAATKKLTLKSGELVDSACLTKAEDKFNGSFTKADDKGGCINTT